MHKDVTTRDATARTPLQEFHDKAVRLALEALDLTFSDRTPAGRVLFESHARERMAQLAQVYVGDLDEARETGRAEGRATGLADATYRDHDDSALSEEIARACRARRALGDVEDIRIHHAEPAFLPSTLAEAIESSLPRTVEAVGFSSEAERAEVRAIVAKASRSGLIGLLTDIMPDGPWLERDGVDVLRPLAEECALDGLAGGVSVEAIRAALVGYGECPRCGDDEIDNLGDGEASICLMCDHAWTPPAVRMVGADRPDAVREEPTTDPARIGGAPTVYTIGADPTPRCEVCDWPLAETVAKGCVPGNCSYRPADGTAEQARIHARREEIAKRNGAGPLAAAVLPVRDFRPYSVTEEIALAVAGPEAVRSSARIYVAGSSKELERAEGAIAALRAGGREVTVDWPAMVRAAGPDALLDLNTLADALRVDLRGIESADDFLFLCPTTPTVGAWVELGYAAGLREGSSRPATSVIAPRISVALPPGAAVRRHDDAPPWVRAIIAAEHAGDAAAVAAMVGR